MLVSIRWSLLGRLARSLLFMGGPWSAVVALARVSPVVVAVGPFPTAVPVVVATARVAVLAFRVFVEAVVAVASASWVVPPRVASVLRVVEGAIVVLAPPSVVRSPGVSSVGLSTTVVAVPIVPPLVVLNLPARPVVLPVSRLVVVEGPLSAAAWALPALEVARVIVLLDFTSASASLTSVVRH